MKGETRIIPAGCGNSGSLSTECKWTIAPNETPIRKSGSGVSRAAPAALPAALPARPMAKARKLTQSASSVSKQVK